VLTSGMWLPEERGSAGTGGAPRKSGGRRSPRQATEPATLATGGAR
jgi:hypothetical protein